MDTTIPNEPMAEIEQLKKQAADNLAGWQRARADYENLKKEWEHKQTQFVSSAKEMLLEDLLPIYDTLRRVLVSAPPNPDPWLVGMQHLYTQWETLFKRWGIELVPTVNHPFDPMIHEAVEERGGHEVVVEELQGGYKIGGKLIMPARVATGPASK